MIHGEILALLRSGPVWGVVHPACEGGEQHDVAGMSACKTRGLGYGMVTAFSMQHRSDVLELAGEFCRISLNSGGGSHRGPSLVGYIGTAGSFKRMD